MIMRRMRRIDRFVAPLLEIAERMARCAVRVYDEPEYERVNKVFHLERALPARELDDLCTAITHALGDYCRDHWIEGCFYVEGSERREPVKRARPAPKAGRPARAPHAR